MSITSRINEMSSHIEQAYDELQGLGADLTNVNKNIENISMVLDDIYDSMPQVSGEGTSLTLDDTRIGKIKSTLKGNTSQTTYSGKNLLGLSNGTNTSGGLTITRNNGLITFTGTASVTYPNTGNVPYTLGTGTYTISSTNNTYDFYLWFRNTNNETIYTANLAKATKTITITTNDIASVVIGVEHLTPGTSYNLSTSIQIESGNSATSYEPYVGGTTSPNPSYPQPVNVVSGDNEIQVCGKNLLNIANWVKGRINNTTGNIEYASNVSSMTIEENDIKFIVSQAWNSGIASDFIPISTGTYTFTFSHNREISVYIDTYKNQNERLSRVVSYTDSASPTTRTFTISDSNVKYIRIHFEVNTANVEYIVSDMQLEKGTTPTDFEPYQGNTYNIDLPVENLWGGFSNSLSRTDSGVQFTANQDGTITASGTATNVATSIILSEATSNGIYKTLQKGTYTVSGGGAKYSVEVYDKNNVVKLGGIPVNGSSVSFTINSETQVVLRIQVANGITINETIKLQLEKGSSANSYTPYGTTPIELCKIGNYQDYFGKSDGRNLFDKSSIEEGKRLGNDGLPFDDTSFDLSDYIKVDSNTQYTYSRGSNGSGSSAIAYYDSSKTFISRTLPIMDSNAREVVLTTPNNATYVRVTDLKTTLDSMQLEKGSSASDYQPYGVGKWYLHKEIGKVVLNGSESGWHTSSLSVTGYKSYYVDSNVRINQDTPGSKCNYFEYKTYNEWQSLLQATFIENTYQAIGIRVVETLAPTLEDFKTWLSTHNTIAYFVLATPTNTEVTYEPLITQLNLLEKAMSKDGQTNISQVNNDLPFIISASALKEWQESASLNSTLSMGNPLSLGNTLNTQENNTQPIEVDNIEPLEEEENEES